MACPAFAEDPPRSPASDRPARGVVRTPLPPQEVEGRPLATVFYDLKGSSGITGGDEQARRRIEESFGIRVGAPFDRQVVSVGLMKVRKLGFVRTVSYTVYESSRPGHLALALSVTLGSAEKTIEADGVATGPADDFPIIYRDERTMLRLLLNGGLGYFTDVNPWFGNAPVFTGRSPVATNPADGKTASWFETSVEYGLGGVRQLGDSPLWAYGASTFLTSSAAGQDLFRNDAREWTEIEEAYLGFVMEIPDSAWVLNVSGGRRDWQLNDGFLFSRFSGAANAGPIPGLFLNPRTAHETTGSVVLHDDKFRIEGFYLDPNELDFVESDTAFAGINVAYASSTDWEGSFAYYEVPESKTAFPAGPGGQAPREGQQTVNFRLTNSQLFGFDGLELSGELAHQTHRHVAWDAWAGYGRIGQTFRDLPWTPDLSYRYASFSGDDPDTPTYERFDAPLSSGLDTWVQGVNVRKVAANSNLDTHRIRLNVAPTNKLTLTLDYFWLMANEPAGGARNIAQELDLGIRWTISRNLFFLGVAGVAFPDERLRQQAVSDLDSWTTLQASLFWNF